MLQSVARMQAKKEGPNLLTIKIKTRGKKTERQTDCRTRVSCTLPSSILYNVLYHTIAVQTGPTGIPSKVCNETSTYLNGFNGLYQI